MSDIEFMTEAEHRAMKMTAELWNHLVHNVVGDGLPRNSDLEELRIQIHGIQHAIMKQAAARAYPDRYRLLGETIQG